MFKKSLIGLLIFFFSSLSYSHPPVSISVEEYQDADGDIFLIVDDSNDYYVHRHYTDSDGEYILSITEDEYLKIKTRPHEFSFFCRVNWNDDDCVDYSHGFKIFQKIYDFGNWKVEKK